MYKYYKSTHTYHLGGVWQLYGANTLAARGLAFPWRLVTHDSPTLPLSFIYIYSIYIYTYSYILNNYIYIYYISTHIYTLAPCWSTTLPLSAPAPSDATFTGHCIYE